MKRINILNDLKSRESIESIENPIAEIIPEEVQIEIEKSEENGSGSEIQECTRVESVRQAKQKKRGRPTKGNA